MEAKAIIANLQFRTADGVVFDRVDANDVDNQGNFIANVDGTIKCFIAGEEIKLPEFFINERGQRYRVFATEEDLKNYIKRLVAIHGVTIARKRGGGARIRVWFDAKEGDKVDSIINQASEANGKVMEGGVVVQDIKGGEKWPQTREYLEANYNFVETEPEGTAIYESKGIPTPWVYCEENIMYPKWGGIDVYATPMLKVDMADPYGVNYIRFWGDDNNLGTYEEIGVFTVAKPKFYEGTMATPIGVREAKFEPPKELYGEEAVA